MQKLVVFRGSLQQRHSAARLSVSSWYHVNSAPVDLYPGLRFPAAQGLSVAGGQPVTSVCLTVTLPHAAGTRQS